MLALSCAVLAGLSSTACITAAAAYDLAVPVPPARVTLNESWRGQPLLARGEEPKGWGWLAISLYRLVFD